MKKKIIIFILGLLLFLTHPKISLAACPPVGPTGGCGIGVYQCAVGGWMGKVYCCDSDSECKSLQSGKTSPATGPQNGAPDPTAGCPSGINTAIGCIPVLTNDNGTAFSGFILRFAIGIGGGIAFILILYAGFMIMSSAGNPERLKAGRELLTSAISGLLLLVFSIFILKFIGIDILGLGRFNFGN